MSFAQIRTQARQEALRLHQEWITDELSGMSLQKLAAMHRNDEIIDSELSEISGDEEESLGLRQIAWTELDFIELKRKTLRGRNPRYIAEHFSLPLVSAHNAPLNPSCILSSRVDEFLQDKRDGNSTLLKSTLDEYSKAIGEFIQCVGDIEVVDVTFDIAKEFRSCLLKLPKHRSKPSYRGKSFQELSALDLPRAVCITPKTIEGRLTKLRSYFDWLEQYRVVEFNPFKGVDIKVKSTSYARYEIEDLNTIFSSALFKDSPYRREHGRKSYWWLVTLGVFTGARIGELAQLRVEDVIEEDEIVSIQLTAEGEGMRLKTDAGNRKFPVHPILLELGFLDYIIELKAKGYSKVLPNLPADIRKSGDAASKWYNARYKDQHIDKSFKKDRKVFHSFRHTFIQESVQSGVELSKLQLMIGHEPKLFGETATYLDEPYTQRQLFEEASKNKFTGLDISVLRGGWQAITRD